jgi:phosphoribosylaminoimidazolecarboxamide formyltransferase/IMP cyclohydrolase
MFDTNSYKIRNVLISVSDKTGIVDFARNLSAMGLKIYSTGGTAKLLEENHIEVSNISVITNFPEILDGRVKTLHPAVHSGLLADLSKERHLEQLNEFNFGSIDMLVVNLYPFEETLNKGGTHDSLIENIDIGGPAMIRAASKNYKWTLPVVNPEHYNEIINILNANNCTIPLKVRAQLAGEAFSLTAYYDSIISNYLNIFAGNKTLKKSALGMKLSKNLRYGENPHQEAGLYGNFEKYFETIHGKELSYNNIVDIDAAGKLIIEFDKPACAIIKHTNPCGVGISENITDAFKKAFETDKVSPFGGIVTVNRHIDKSFAEYVHDIFTEVIIAPDFDDDALDILMKKKNRRLIKMNFEAVRNYFQIDIKSVTGGYLMQNSDDKLVAGDGYKVVSKRQPTDEELEALDFAWKVCKHVKSNAIVYASSEQTLGIGAGQMSRVDSSRIAVEKSKLSELSLAGSVVASDAFFPFADGLTEAAKAGATAAIQPGGSVRDEEVIKAADENNMAMIFTGMRHFKH